MSKYSHDCKLRLSFNLNRRLGMNRAIYMLSASHSRVGKMRTFFLSFVISCRFSHFSSNFLHFLPQFGLPGGRLAHPESPRYATEYETHEVLFNALYCGRVVWTPICWRCCLKSSKRSPDHNFFSFLADFEQLFCFPNLHAFSLQPNLAYSTCISYCFSNL